MRNLKTRTIKSVIVASILVCILIAIGVCTGIVRWRVSPPGGPSGPTGGDGTIAGENSDVEELPPKKPVEKTPRPDPATEPQAH